MREGETVAARGSVKLAFTGAVELTNTAAEGGTEDIFFYKRLKNERVYERAGWPEIQKKRYPVLCDTNMFCRHITMDGVQYPAAGEELQYAKVK